ncbi:hydrophobin family protein [Streptomyces yaizuensis]|uniref:Uncharacterized protein n=1 Tax=Streptomyces yaizuensis TaxID=2989713 RepID=A0ABQ5P3M9_9ACTN|nr:hydrophobin family protein [Streptomyces sp. YSPA8]GLF97185.1 hypothetical protein SYYSPA8_22830 [Streptomyces sp. YSPA8]
MQNTAHRLAAPTAAAVLALGAALAGAVPAHAAGPTPLRCERVGSPADDPAIGALAALLGITVQDISGPVGLDCTEVPGGDGRVNFCATQNYGVLAVGDRPSGRTCR